MKIKRTMPPVANPVTLMDLLHGLSGMLHARRELERFTSEIKEYFGVEHVYLTSSGKAALTLILKALKTLSPQRKRVLIPAYTCYSVPSAIVKAGLEVALSDIDPDTLDFDKSVLEVAMDEETLCVVPSHLFGVPSDVELVLGLARKAGAYVVEDAAQAMGVSFNGAKLGTLGDVGFLSLGRGKNVTAGGGGIIITNSKDIARALDEFYSLIEGPGLVKTIKELLALVAMKLFIRPSLYWLPAALPFLRLGETIFHSDFPVKRLSGMQAGVMKGWERRLDSQALIRTETARYFQERLSAKPAGAPCYPYLRVPLLAKSIEERDRLYNESRLLGLGISLMYPAAINEIPEMRDRFGEESYPRAEGVARRLLALPTHYLLTGPDKEAVLELCERSLNPGGHAVTGLPAKDIRETCHNN